MISNHTSGNKECGIHTHILTHTHTHTHTHTIECYSAMRKKETLWFATTWMDPKGIMLRKIS